ncbi:DUF6368 family protein [Aureibacter tunicatorum]
MSNKIWPHHFCDIEFLEEWLKSPHFHLIK